jgi:hypothetical protein
MLGRSKKAQIQRQNSRMPRKPCVNDVILQTQGHALAYARNYVDTEEYLLLFSYSETSFSIGASWGNQFSSKPLFRGSMTEYITARMKI